MGTGSPVNSKLPIAPDMDKNELGLDAFGMPIDSDSTSSKAVTCKPLDCTPESLGCEMLAINPMTGCTTCACAENPSISGLYLRSIDEDLSSISSVGEPEIENPCPDPRELLQTEGSYLGKNIVGRAARYKLSIGKLKRGFQPGEKYKIQLHKHAEAEPFRAFLFDIKPAPQAAGGKNNRKASNKPTSEGNDTSSSDTVDGTCGAGYLIDTGNGTNSVRAIPHCRSSALEGDGLSNKTEVEVEWIAPSCGCVHIRAAVVDYTDKVVYMDPSLSTENPLEKPTKSKKTLQKKPLFITVCAKGTGKKGRPDKGNPKGNLPSWIVSDCCLAGIPKSKKMGRKANKAELCERDSILYSTAEYFSYRFSVIRKTCRKAYKKCCVMAQDFDIGNGNKGGKDKQNLSQTKKQKPHSSSEALSVAVMQLPSSADDKSTEKGNKKGKKNKGKKRRKKNKGKANKGKGKNKKTKKLDRKKRIKKRKTQKQNSS